MVTKKYLDKMEELKEKLRIAKMYCLQFPNLCIEYKRLVEEYKNLRGQKMKGKKYCNYCGERTDYLIYKEGAFVCMVCSKEIDKLNKRLEDNMYDYNDKYIILADLKEEK